MKRTEVLEILKSGKSPDEIANALYIGYDEYSLRLLDVGRHEALTALGVEKYDAQELHRKLFDLPESMDFQDVETGKIWTRDELAVAVLRRIAGLDDKPIPDLACQRLRHSVAHCENCPHLQWSPPFWPHGPGSRFSLPWCGAPNFHCPDVYTRIACEAPGKEEALAAFLAAISPFGSLMAEEQRKRWPDAFGQALHGKFDPILGVLGMYVTSEASDLRIYPQSWGFNIITPTSGTRIGVTPKGAGHEFYLISVNFGPSGAANRPAQIMGANPNVAWWVTHKDESVALESPPIPTLWISIEDMLTNVSTLNAEPGEVRG